MSADAVAEIVNYDEGVVATRSGTRFLICLPGAESALHELRIISVLWQVWKATRSDVYSDDMQWIVNVPELDKLTIPLTSILSAIECDLSKTGHKLLVVGGPIIPIDGEHVIRFPQPYSRLPRSKRSR